MLQRKKYLFILLIVFSITLFSCDKKDDPEVKPNGNDPEPTVPFEPPQTKDIVMYEINLRAFSQSGDIQGVINRLDKIEDLGINVIWLMPIYPIGEINSVNSPYSVKNFKEVNPEHGTLDDLKSLVSLAHEKGIAVILDWVANHTAWDNPWITNTDWYTQDGNGNIVHPPGTNWQDVADLNYNNQEMRLAMIDAMKYWINEADIDGYRCDAADMVPFNFWKQAIDSLNANTEKDLVLLAEGARADHFTAGFDLNFSWDFYNTIKNVFNGNSSAGFIFSTHNSEYNAVPDGKHKLRFTTNHDESAWDATPMVLFGGKEGALAASVITIFLGGVPMIYGCQEVGVTQNVSFFSQSPVNWSLNPGMLQTYEDLLQYYNSSQPAKQGTLETYNHSTVAAFKRIFEQEELFVLVNTRNNTVNFELPPSLHNSTWTNAIGGSTVSLNTSINIAPFEYLILKK
ncbi:MAG: alpha-amylase [Bacteroidales bacterium]|nr:alpha-amylase [Bacteroidales bacterium]MCF8402368.1 alpha-amylase [Bacteroidales bacterium]